MLLGLSTCAKSVLRSAAPNMMELHIVAVLG